MVGNELWAGPSVNPDIQRITVVTDGKSDILFQHTDGRTHGWAVNGGSLLTSTPLTSLGSSYRVKGIGDFNAGGSDDLLLRDGAGNNKVVQLGASSGAMTVGTSKDVVPAGLNWDVAAVGDFDGDGKDDILWREVGGYNFMYYAVQCIDGGGSAERGRRSRHRLEGGRGWPTLTATATPTSSGATSTVPTPSGT